MPRGEEEILLRLEGQNAQVLSALEGVIRHLDQMGQRSATANQQLRAISEHAESASRVLSGFGAKIIALNEALSLTGKVAHATVGALRLLKDQTVGAASRFGEYSEELNIISGQLRATVTGYQAVTSQLVQVGINSDVSRIAMTRLAGEIGLAEKQTSKTTETLRALGVTIEDSVTGKTKPAEVVLLDVAKALGKVENSYKAQQLAGNLFSDRLARQILPSLVAWGRSTDDVSKGLAAITEEQAKAGEEFDSFIDRINLATQVLQLQKGALAEVAAAPFVKTQAAVMEALARTTASFSGELETAVRWVGILTLGVGALASVGLIAFIRVVGRASVAVATLHAAWRALTELWKKPQTTEEALAKPFKVASAAVQSLALSGGFALLLKRFGGLQAIVTALGARAGFPAVATGVNLVVAALTGLATKVAVFAALAVAVTGFIVVARRSRDEIAELGKELDRLKAKAREKGVAAPPEATSFGVPVGFELVALQRLVDAYRKLLGEDSYKPPLDFTDEERIALKRKRLEYEKQRSDITAAEIERQHGPLAGIGYRRKADRDYYRGLEKLEIEQAEEKTPEGLSREQRHLIEDEYRGKRIAARKQYDEQEAAIEKQHQEGLTEASIKAEEDRKTSTLRLQQEKAKAAFDQKKLDLGQLLAVEKATDKEIYDARHEALVKLQGIAKEDRDPVAYQQKTNEIVALEYERQVEIEQQERDHYQRRQGLQQGFDEQAIRHEEAVNVTRLEMDKAAGQGAFAQRKINLNDLIDIEQEADRKIYQQHRQALEQIAELAKNDPSRDPVAIRQANDAIAALDEEFKLQQLQRDQDYYDRRKQLAEQLQELRERVAELETEAFAPNDQVGQRLQQIGQSYRNLVKQLKEAGLVSEIDRVRAAFQRLAEDTVSTFVELRPQLQGALADLFSGADPKNTLKALSDGIRRSFAEGFAEAFLEKIRFEGRLRLNVNREVPEIAAQGARNWARPWAAVMNLFRGGTGSADVSVSPSGTASIVGGLPSGSAPAGGTESFGGFVPVGEVGGTPTRRGGAVIEDALGQRFGVQSESQAEELAAKGVAVPQGRSSTQVGITAGGAAAAVGAVVTGLFQLAASGDLSPREIEGLARSGRLTQAIKERRKSHQIEEFFGGTTLGTEYKHQLSKFFEEADVPRQREISAGGHSGVRTKHFELPITDEQREAFRVAGFGGSYLDAGTVSDKLSASKVAKLQKYDTPELEQLRTGAALGFGAVVGENARAAFNVANTVTNDFIALGASAEEAEEYMDRMAETMQTDLPSALDELNKKSKEGKYTQGEFLAVLKGAVEWLGDGIPKAIDTAAIALRYLRTTGDQTSIRVEAFTQYLEDMTAALGNIANTALGSAIGALFDKLGVGLTDSERRLEEINKQLDIVSHEGRIKALGVAIDQARLFGDEAAAAIAEAELASEQLALKAAQAAEEALSPAQAFMKAIKDGIRDTIVNSVVSAITEAGVIQAALEPFFAKLDEYSQWLKNNPGATVGEKRGRFGAVLKAGTQGYSDAQGLYDQVIGPEIESLTNTPEGRELLGIPAMARGGYVTQPTLALIGEKGPERVMPLSRMPLTKSLPHSPSSGHNYMQPINVNVTGNTVMGLSDAEALADMVGDAVLRAVKLNRPMGL